MEIQKHSKIGLSSFYLKMIAIISMLIDHIGAVIIESMLTYNSINGIDDESLLNTYYIMRSIGRIAFPIFCFLLIQGYLHTSDIKKYLTRLFIFAFISEIPFDLANFNEILEFSYQNVFFTLFFGLLAIYISDSLVKNLVKKSSSSKSLKSVLNILIFLIIFSLAGYITYLLNTDYSYYGILLILLLYKSSNNKIYTAISLFIGLLFERHLPFVFLSIPIILLYNGEKGKNIKYFFYIFYPAHLTILYIINNFYFMR